MTNEEIDKLEAGREMDALVAEEVMGWTHNEKNNYPWYDSKHWGHHKLRHFSTSISAAWEVVEKLRSGSRVIHEERWITFVWNLDGANLGIHSLMQKLSPLAICRAALKAVSHQDKTDAPVEEI